MTPARGRLSSLERALRIFTEVRPGEGRTALLMFANVFLILSAYYLVKPLRDGWLAVSDLGGLSDLEMKAYNAFGQSLLLVFVVRVYGGLVARMPRGRLIAVATLFCMSNMVVFWLLQPDFFFAHLPGTGIAFYLWVGMFGVFVVAQFWTFAADLYTDERGRRLLPFIAIGATAGGAFGAEITRVLVESGLFGTKSLLLVALVPLSVSILLTRAADRLGPLGRGPRAGVEGARPPRGGRAEAPGAEMRRGAGREGLALILRSRRFLLPVAVVTLLTNWVNTNGESVLFAVVQQGLDAQALAQGIADPIARRAFIQDGTTLFYSDFYSWVNWAALLLQALVASRLLRFGGFGAILLLLPVISLVSYATMALLPVLAVIKIMKIAENSTDYSINNTARHVLWLPVGAEAKYQGKPAVDTFFVRMGDGLAALTVLVGGRLLGVSVDVLLAFTVVLVVVWIAQAVPVVGEHARLSREAGTDAPR